MGQNGLSHGALEVKMISRTLREAREYEERMEVRIALEDRPAFHLSPRTGWMNDPNGFSYYKGEYHLFYQYHPYDSFWGPMHWGHAVSRDLLHWDYLPAALAPDTVYDRDGCFSGSSVELPDGRQLLMYTGVVKQQRPGGGSKEIQTQCIAVGDGRDYEKYAANPVLTEKDLPMGGADMIFEIRRYGGRRMEPTAAWWATVPAIETGKYSYIKVKMAFIGNLCLCLLQITEGSAGCGSVRIFLN